MGMSIMLSELQNFDVYKWISVILETDFQNETPSSNDSFSNSVIQRLYVMNI